MLKLFSSVLLISILIPVHAQKNDAALLQELGKNQPANQNITTTATLKSASRLFGTKDDLTSVILVIPSGSTVNILDSDSTYLLVSFEENEGYIFKRHAVIDKTPDNPPETRQSQQVEPAEQQNQKEQPEQKDQLEQENQGSRFSYLESKYGTNMAARLNAGKIWRGMNTEMVRDSWGRPEKINRVISGNTIQEEWIFRNAWLYFENSSLEDWGPIMK
jgi:hypothetical protein